MKFYNPFKYHIVLGTDGIYRVRKLHILCFGWGFLDVVELNRAIPDVFYWSKHSRHFKDCSCSSKEQAQQIISKLTKKLKFTKVD